MGVNKESYERTHNTYIHINMWCVYFVCAYMYACVYTCIQKCIYCLHDAGVHIYIYIIYIDRRKIPGGFVR